MPNKTIAQAKEINKRKIIEQVNNDIEIDTKAVKNMFKKKEICGIAKESNFIQRERKLNAYDFFYH